MERKVEITENEANVIMAALGELPGKIGFEAQYLIRSKFNTVVAQEQALTQQAFAALEEKQTPTPQK